MSDMNIGLTLMFKLRKCDAKDFAFYTSPSGVDLSHFCIIGKMCEFSNATPQMYN